MRGQRSSPLLAKRAVVLQVLRDDHAERWSRAELSRQLLDFRRDEVEAAIRELAAKGVVMCEGHQVWASRATQTLDALMLISI
jgi:hypothetical protein